MHLKSTCKHCAGAGILLGRMAGISTNMLCECPRRVADIIAQFVSFEQYSQNGLNEASEDALQMLAEHEGLTLQTTE